MGNVVYPVNHRQPWSRSNVMDSLHAAPSGHMDILLQSPDWCCQVILPPVKSLRVQPENQELVVRCSGRFQGAGWRLFCPKQMEYSKTQCGMLIVDVQRFVQPR